MTMRQLFRKKSNFIFYQILTVGMSLIFLFSWLGFRLYPKLLLLLNSLQNKIDEICGCSNHFYFLGHPYFSSLLMLSGLGTAALLLFGLIQIVKLKISTSKFIKTKLNNKKFRLSPKLKNVALSLNLLNNLIEVQDENPYVFCYGIFQPKICVSGGLVKDLNNAELGAVLKHEEHHLKNYEPTKLFIVKVLTKIFFFVPGFKILKNQYALASELEADERATDYFRDRTPLAGALYKILKQQEQIKIRRGLAISFLSATEERMRKLVDNNHSPRIKTIVPKFFASAFFLILLLVYTGSLISSDKLLKINEGANSCLVVREERTNQCHKLRQEPLCKMGYNPEKHSCQKTTRYKN